MSFWTRIRAFGPWLRARLERNLEREIQNYLALEPLATAQPLATSRSSRKMSAKRGNGAAGAIHTRYPLRAAPGAPQSLILGQSWPCSPNRAVIGDVVGPGLTAQRLRIKLASRRQPVEVPLGAHHATRRLLVFRRCGPCSVLSRLDSSRETSRWLASSRLTSCSSLVIEGIPGDNRRRRITGLVQSDNEPFQGGPGVR